MAASLIFVRHLLLGLLGVAALGACGDNSTTPPAAAPTPSVASAVTVPGAASVADSLAFSAPRVGGGTINMADYAGKPVLLWFWAPN